VFFPALIGAWGGSIKATTFIRPPQCGQASGLISYTRLMSMDVFLIALLVSSLAVLLYYLRNVSNEKGEFLWRFDNAET
jgi:hypothetical protein